MADEPPTEPIDVLIANAAEGMPPLINVALVKKTIQDTAEWWDLPEALAELVNGENAAGEWIGDAVFTGSAIGYGDARLEAKNNIITFRPSKLEMVDANGVAWGPMAPAAAIKFMRDRKIALPETYYGEFAAEARYMGFSIAGIHQVETLDMALRSLSDALNQGMTYLDWKAQILDDPLLAQLPDWRLENIYRTNLQTAYAHGRHTQQYENIGSRPYGMIRTVKDDRRRPNHGRLEGFIARLDDPIWNRVSPPLGYNCRCKRLSITRAQAEARGITRERDFQADEGFGLDPARDAAFGVKRGVRAWMRRAASAFIPVLTRILSGG